ncbi:MAG: FAD-dependent oxidoreductase [Sphingobacteriaceae bacterium]|nr:FAD-dependent oxidoreductase [Sphingobacteriaceae bacterium]
MKNKDHIENMRDGQTESPWQSSLNRQIQPNAAENGVIYDTLVVGGGITGVTTAFLLQKSGQKCVLAEAHQLGFGTTGGTTAHLNTFFDTTYPEINSAFGTEAATMMATAAKNVIDFIKANIDTLDIDADFEYKDAYLFSQNEKETDQLQEILSAAKQAGVSVSEVFENGVPINFEHALLFKDQAQFHPLKYIYAIAQAFQKLGGILLENTIITDSSFKDEIHSAEAGHINLKAKNLVYATHIPPGVNLLSLRNAPYRSYVLGVKLEDDEYPESLAYDMQEPYHYFRPHKINGEKILIVGGGEDHKTGHGDPQQAFKNLKQYVRKYFKVSDIPYHWSSQYYIPVDGLPYIGHLPGGDERIFTATGFNGNGMILGTLSAMIIHDLILNKENRYADLFKPSRLKLVAGFTEFVKENADVAYHFIADRLSAETLDSINQLEPDEGKIVSFDGHKIAVYKDAKGKVTALSPTCTHAGCIVNWNGAEKSWDCPCHGGRYAIDGKVITGPPQKNLEQIDINNVSFFNEV